MKVRLWKNLYYVLNRISIQIPPLRSRKEDIPTIVEHLLVKLNQEFGMNIVRDFRAALQRLVSSMIGQEMSEN